MKLNQAICKYIGSIILSRLISKAWLGGLPQNEVPGTNRKLLQRFLFRRKLREEHEWNWTKTLIDINLL